MQQKEGNIINTNMKFLGSNTNGNTNNPLSKHDKYEKSEIANNLRQKK